MRLSRVPAAWGTLGLAMAHVRFVRLWSEETSRRITLFWQSGNPKTMSVQHVLTAQPENCANARDGSSISAHPPATAGGDSSLEQARSRFPSEQSGAKASSWHYHTSTSCMLRLVSIIMVNFLRHRDHVGSGQLPPASCLVARQ